jgi:hypothetical protein
MLTSRSVATPSGYVLPPRTRELRIRIYSRGMRAWPHRVLAAVGAVVIVGAGLKVATVPELPVVFRCGVVVLLAVGLFSCVRAWFNVPLHERELAIVYLGAVIAIIVWRTRRDAGSGSRNDLYVAHGGNDCVRLIDAAGAIRSVAGGR